MKIIAKRRRLENKTDYLNRRRLLEGGKPRVVVRKTNKYIILQYVESREAQDKVINSVVSSELLNHGWPADKAGSLKSLAAAYLTGILFAKTVKSTKDVVLDMGLLRNTPGSRIYAALKGMVDGGMKIRHDAKIFPDEKRIKSENTKAFFDSVKLKVEGGSKK